MALLTPEQDRLLTDAGFIERFEHYWLYGNMTQFVAWQKADNDVREIRGRGRYDNDNKFDSFISWYKQRRARLKKAVGKVS